MTAIKALRRPPPSPRTAYLLGSAFAVVSTLGACSASSPVSTSSSSASGSGSHSASHASSSGTGGSSASQASSSASSSNASTSSATTTVSSSGAGGASGSGTSNASSGSTSSGSGGAGGSYAEPVGTADYPTEVEPNDSVSLANPLAAGTKGFTAAINPLADIDVFSFVVTKPGSGITVATSDGLGGCPLGAHTYLRVFDASGNVLAQDTGKGGCVSFTPANQPQLFDVPAGTYYAHVESETLFVLPRYVIDIAVTPPTCGDGLTQVNASEQCDHGTNNGTSNAECSAACQLPNGPYLDEKEPNDTLASANDLTGYVGAVGQIAPVGDSDWYSFDVTVPGSSVVAQIGDGFGACPSGFDSQLTLYNASMSKLATDAGSGVSPCSKITPALYPAAANLAVGTYAVEVQRVSSLVQSSYVLSLKVTPPGCGDGVLPEGTKQCDPPAPNPGCSATCQLTGDFIPETEPNNTQATANALGTHAGFIASIKPLGDIDCFSFNVPGPSSEVFLQTTDGIGGCPSGFSSALTLYGPSGTLLLQDTSSAPGRQCSEINPNIYAAAASLPSGTYRACAQYASNATTFWQYVLTASVRQPGCGDGVLQTGEQCDDGPLNGSAGDGCSATCQSLAPWEIEPNGSGATATPQWSGYSTWKASISPVGDHDMFTFTTAATATVTLTTHDVDKPAYCSSDTLMTLFDSTMAELQKNDDAGPGPGDPPGGQCSKIVQAALPAGTYYALVQAYADARLIPSYQLDLLVQ